MHPGRSCGPLQCNRSITTRKNRRRPQAPATVRIVSACIQPVWLLAGERCFYATGARRIYQTDEIIDRTPIYGTLYITNLRVIFIHKWHGAEFLAFEVRACAVKRKKVIIQTVNNCVFVVSRPKDVASMIERMRSHGSTGIVDMIFDHEDGQSETPDEPIPVKL